MAPTSHAQKILVFCDGAAKGNPGPGGWGVVIVTPDGHVRERGGGALMVTNNQMELLGAINGLSALWDVPGPVAVFTDSTYVLHGITAWVFGWMRKGWKTAEGKDVANADLWQQLHSLVARRKSDAPIEWHYVRGHVGVPGNERVDTIASTFALRRSPALYDGPLLKYDIPIFDLPDDTSIPPMNFDHQRTEKKQALCYLSLVDGILERHATWAQCEARVKGRPAKFKKAMSEDEVASIRKSWGV